MATTISITSFYPGRERPSRISAAVISASRLEIWLTFSGRFWRSRTGIRSTETRCSGSTDGCARFREEQEDLRVRLSYPEKFWKLADHYYGSRKSWIPEKNVEKLRSLIRQREQRSSFLKILE